MSDLRSSNILSPVRPKLVTETPLYYSPFEFIRNALRESPLIEKNDSLRLLFLNCVDLRSVFNTVGGSSEVKQLDIHLNDSNPLVVARNILILHIINSPDFDLENPKDFNFLWDVWFNWFWSKDTSLRFKSNLNELLDGNLPDNIVISRSCERTVLNEVWQKWVLLLDSEGTVSSDLFQQLSASRETEQLDQWNKKISYLPPWYVLNSSTGTSFRSLSHYLKLMANKIKSLLLDYILVLNISTENLNIEEEVIHYLENGYCFRNRCDSRTRNAAVNLTFIDPTSKSWSVELFSEPFTGFFSMIKEHVAASMTFTKSQKNVLLINCQTFFRILVTKYLRKRESVKIVFHLRDPIEFCYYESQLTFDLIDCGTVGDEVGLANLLPATREVLSCQPFARVRTGTSDWRLLASTLEEYIEKILSVPISMIPTVYGFKLENNLEFGAPDPIEFCYLHGLDTSLFWHPCKKFFNVPLVVSNTLKSCFDDIMKKCFVFDESQETPQGDEIPRHCWYTPMTFHLIANDLLQRISSKSNMKILTSIQPSRCFQLHFRTIEAWARGEKLVKYSSVEAPEVFPLGLASLSPRQFDFPASSKLRLAILSPDSLPNGSDIASEQSLTSSEAHFIDNFSVSLVCNEPNQDSPQLHLSFVLPKNCNVPKTHHCVVYEIRLRRPLYSFGPIRNHKEEPLVQKYPLNVNAIQYENQPSFNISELKWFKCYELKDKYEVDIEVKTVASLKSFSFSVVSHLPCEASHSVTVAFKKSKAFTFRLPYPFILQKIVPIIDQSKKLIRFTLSKALREPWPFQFQLPDTAKLNVDSFDSWDDDRNMSLRSHLYLQFRNNEIDDVDPTTFPINEVRKTVLEIFRYVDVENCCTFMLGENGKKNRFEWFLRVHPPIRVAPNGVPYLLISAFDNDLADKLAEHCNVSMRELRQLANFSPCGVLIVMKTVEETELFRYLLRSNSVKVNSSDWQKRNLPVHKKSPWITTFISPLYEENTSNCWDSALEELEFHQRVFNYVVGKVMFEQFLASL